MLFNLLRKFFSSEIEALENAARNQGYRTRFDEEQELKFKCKVFSAEEAVGKKVIYCSNEWQDPIFGKVIGVEIIKDVVFLRIENALDGEIYVQHEGSVYLADNKMIEAILKLDPFERWNLSAGRVYLQNMWEKTYENGAITSPKKLREKLIEVGFYTPGYRVNDNQLTLDFNF